MVRGTILTLAGAAALLLPAGAAADPAVPARATRATVIDTSVKITSVTKKRTRHGRVRVVAGRVSSRKSACVDGAKVEVFVQEQTSQPVKIGSDRANSEGKFSVSERISNARGDRTYAYLVPRTLGNAKRCEGARSDSVPLSGRAARPRAHIDTGVAVDGIYSHYFTPVRATKQRAPNGIDVYGHLESDRSKCLKGRKVTLFRVAGGPDTKVGYDGSSSRGGWSVYVPLNRYEGGTYYAKVASLKLKNGDICSAARSPNSTFA